MTKTTFKKGDLVIAIRNGKSQFRGSSFKAGSTKKVAAVAGQRVGYYGSSTPYGAFQTAGGGVFYISDFKVCTVLEAAEQAVKELEAQVTAAKAKAEALRNPPINVGDTFEFAVTGAEYKLLFKNDELVLYQAVVSKIGYTATVAKFKASSAKKVTK